MFFTCYVFMRTRENITQENHKKKTKADLKSLFQNYLF